MKNTDRNTARRQAITEIISETNGKITQGEIVAKMKARDMAISQSGVSRLLKTMGFALNRETNEYESSEAARQEEQRKELKDFLIKTDTEQHDIVEALLTTRSGYANAVATLLKETYPEQIIATIAQDDTILVFVVDDFTDDFLKLLSDVQKNRPVKKRTS